MTVPALDTANIGPICYYRQPGCTKIVLSDILPYLNRVDHYEDDGSGGAEYVDGQFMVYQTGIDTGTGKNMVYVRIRADGWILAWLMKRTYSIKTVSGCTYVNATNIDCGVDTDNVFDYSDQYNSCWMKVTSSTPAGANCVNKYYVISGCNSGTNVLTAFKGIFQTGYTYTIDIYQNPAELEWKGFEPTGSSVGETVPLFPTYPTTTLSRAIYEILTRVRQNMIVTNAPSSLASPFNVIPPVQFPGEYTPVKYALQNDIGVGFTDYTAEANNATANDVLPFPAAEVAGDEFYIGFNEPADRVCINVDTAGVGTGTLQWYYWKAATGWTTFTPGVISGNISLKATGMNIFTISCADSTSVVNGLTAYWIKAVMVGTYTTTNPLITQIWSRVGFANPAMNLWNYEFPSAAHFVILAYSNFVKYTSPNWWFYFNILNTVTVYWDAFVVNNFSSYAGDVITLTYNDSNITSLTAVGVNTTNYYDNSFTNVLAGIYGGSGNLNIIRITYNYTSSYSTRFWATVSLLFFTD